MINAIIRDLPAMLIKGYDVANVPVLRDIVGINGFVWQGTLAIAGVIFAYTWGYNLAKAYKVNAAAGGVVGLATLFQGVAFSASTAINVPKGELGQKALDLITAAGSTVSVSDVKDPVTGAISQFDTITTGAWGWLKLAHLGGNAYFTVMILGAISVIIYSKLMLKNITIKLPDSVPPAISKAFAAIIPATVALYVIAIINYVVGKVSGGQLLIDLIQKYIAEPFMGATQSLFAVLIIGIFIQVLWFFGLHGPNIMAPILEGIYGQAQLVNQNIYQAGYNGLKGADAVKEAVKDGKAYNWVRGSFDAYAWFGGSGGTLVLIVAIILFSKREDYRAVGKLSLGPGIFNINEPVMFGLPIVLNPILVIPFVLAPTASLAIGWLATNAGLVNPVTQAPTWVTPPFLLSFMATFDWRAPIVTLVCVIVSFFIWAPFVIAANKVEIPED
ncbi:PTS sugar transporter subunit IIC [Floricoccus tropicus]